MVAVLACGKKAAPVASASDAHCARAPQAAPGTARDASLPIDLFADDAGEQQCPELDPQRPLPTVSAPEVVGVLVGPEAANPIYDLHLYGTDLGFTFEHDGQLFVMFGDTLPTPDDICRDQHNDDTLATLPKSYAGAVPEITFRSKPDSPDDFSKLQLVRDGRSLSLGFGKAPTTAFSDGRRVFAVFDHLELTRCKGAGSSGAGSCPSGTGLACSKRIGECQPSYSGVVPPLCNLDTQRGCFAGQKCAPASAPVCFDKTSSQYDCSVEGEIAATAQNADIGVQRADDPDMFDSVLVLPTNKFINVTARTVERFGGKCGGNDYRPGHGAVLLWGRPRYAAEGAREAQLYLMAHSLPLTLDDSGALRFEPRYFAGVDEKTGEPEWSQLQSDAKPLAMDGIAGGDPHEALHIVNHTTISWLGPPVERWVMLYGGGLSDQLLFDPAHAQYSPAPGAIMIRFADHPWGPWSPPVPHFVPGSPSKAGAPNGPGGILYNADCKDAASGTCARPDSLRSRNNVIPSCLAGLILWDRGRLYGASIIDTYTGPNSDQGLDVVWNVSTWNPYAVVLMKTAIGAGR